MAGGINRTERRYKDGWTRVLTTHISRDLRNVFLCAWGGGGGGEDLRSSRAAHHWEMMEGWMSRLVLS